MAQQSLQKRRLEEKLGLNEDQTIKSGFDQETMAIVWDIMNKKYDGLLDHPLINYDEQSWPRWVFFLIVHDVHAAIWAVEEKDLKNLDVVAQEYLRVCPWENQAGGDNAQIMDFAQTWHNWWVWWDINLDKKQGRNIEFPGIYRDPP